MMRERSLINWLKSSAKNFLKQMHYFMQLLSENKIYKVLRHKNDGKPCFVNN